MIAVRFLIGFMFLVAYVSAMPLEDLTKLDIVKTVEFLEHATRADVTINETTSENEVIKTFSVSRGRVTSTGISCQGICTVSMNYDVAIDGVASEYLASRDSVFRSALNDSQRSKYDSAKKSFGGGLRVPFLRAVGINLGGRYSKTSIDSASDRLKNYESLANSARSIMNSFDVVKVRVFGSMKVTSYSRRKSTASAYVKFAKVTLVDGSELRVVSGSGSDVSIQNDRGDEMDMEDWNGGAEQVVDNSNPLL